jgi:probable addiction module antidote protein
MFHNHQMERQKKRHSKRPIKAAGDVTGELEQLKKAVESGNPHVIANAIGRVGRAYGMVRLAAEMGFNNGQIYRTFGPDGNPMLSTLLRALEVLGLRLSIERIPPKVRNSAQLADCAGKQGKT